MEDQSADSGDLTTDAGAASVPQGKATRSRHRLPRQKARQPGEDVEAASVDDGPHAEPEVAEPTEVVEVAGGSAESNATDDGATDETDDAEITGESEDAPDAADTSTTEVAAAEPVEVTKRRRRPWRRNVATGDVATGDVATGDPSPLPEVDDPDAPAPPVSVVTDTDTNTDGDTLDAEAAEAEPEPVLVPHRPAGRFLKTVAVAAGVLFIVAGAFAGATLQPYLADRAAVQEKFEIAETAASAITTLWTYSPDDMASLADRSAKYLSNDFANEYRNYIDGIAETNKQAQVTNNTQVLGAAVESLSATDATAIVYTNSVATSPLTKGIPSLRYFAYRLTLVRDGSRWLVTQMIAVTKLDLTPRL